MEMYTEQESGTTSENSSTKSQWKTKIKTAAKYGGMIVFIVSMIVVANVISTQFVMKQQSQSRKTTHSPSSKEMKGTSSLVQQKATEHLKKATGDTVKATGDLLPAIIQNAVDGNQDPKSMKLSVGMRNDYLLQDCNDHGLKKSFPDLDYALLGYNIMKGYPLAKEHDPGFTQPIFKADYTGNRQSADCKFSIPAGYSIMTDVSCLTTFSSQAISNVTQLKEALTASAKISGGGWGVAFSASTSYNQAREEVQSGEKVYVISKATCQYYFSRLDEQRPPPFHDSFLKWVNRLNTSKRDQDFIDFIVYYGTHFAKTMTFGARYTYIYSMTKESYSSLQKESISVEAQASLSGFGASFGASGGMSNDKQEAVKKFNEEITMQTVTVGSVPPSDGDALKWASTVKETPVPFKYELASIMDIFHPAFFTRYPNINTERIRNYLQYIQMIYSKDISSGSRNKVCRVYNSVFQLPQRTCLHGYYQHSKNKKRSKSDCIQECLASRGCIGITMTRSLRCYLYSNNYTQGMPVKNDSSMGECSSMVFPYHMQIITDTYTNKPIPGLLRLRGISVRNSTHGECVQTQGTAEQCREQCESKCVDDKACVLSSIKYKSPGTYCCKLYNDNDVSEKALDITENMDDHFTFIKTC